MKQGGNLSSNWKYLINNKKRKAVSEEEYDKELDSFNVATK